MAFLLRLNHENNKLSVTGREMRRRVMWSIFILERRLAGGQLDLISCRKDLMHIQLPSNERDFELGIQSTTGSLLPGDVDEQPSSMGTRAYYCRLSSIRHDILQYTRTVISEGTEAHDSRDELVRLERNLMDLRNSQPESMQLSQRNMSFRAYSPHMRRYLMLHAMWHQCYCDLYRFMIPGLRDSLSEEAFKKTSPEYISYCQAEAIKHGKALVGLFRMVQDVGDGTPQDPGINVCVYQCARIIIRAFDLGLLGSFSTALEVLLQLKDAAKIMIPIIAVKNSTGQLYHQIQKMISFAVQRASGSDLMTQALQTEQTHDPNVLDILARIRQSDIETGEEVLQDYPASPVATPSLNCDVAPETAANYIDKGPILEEPLGNPGFVEPSWYTGFENEHLFSSFGNTFSGFEDSFIDFEYQDIDQCYSEQ
ncbi:hypothetical protein N7541_006314 [Penicillium brevicompactum]|uniref:Transcription factor domain-containing protein n=1 Tax=Penicillium brevicompactum TaxID=5074 RepID=A0A9W9R507_PENBR|nr:hypothetical protein N7541_006314 [Penicillium brevicompactum]